MNSEHLAATQKRPSASGISIRHPTLFFCYFAHDLVASLRRLRRKWQTELGGKLLLALETPPVTLRLPKLKKGYVYGLQPYFLHNNEQQNTSHFCTYHLTCFENRSLHTLQKEQNVIPEASLTFSPFHPAWSLPDASLKCGWCSCSRRGYKMQI